MMENQSLLDTVVDVDSEGDAQKEEVDDKSRSSGSVSQKRKVDDNDDDDESDDDDETEDDETDEEEEDDGDKDKGVEDKSSCPDDYSDQQFEKDFQEYLRQAEESEGFDIDTFPRRPLLGGLWKVQVDNRKDGFLKLTKKALRTAIREQNKTKGANLELVKMIKAIMNGPSLFYITFEAKNKTTGEVNVYQTRVYQHCVDGDTEVEIFRLKKMGDKKVQA